MAERYYLGPNLLDKIRGAVDRSQSDPISRSAYRVPTRLQDLPLVIDGASLSRGTFTQTSWAVGATALVTITGDTQTYSVTNYCTPVKGSENVTHTLNVIFGDVMGTMTAIEIQQPTCTMSIGGLDLTELPYYVSGEIQLLGHGVESTGTTSCSGLQWYSITNCATTAT